MGVGHDLEGQGGEGLAVVGLALDGRVAGRVLALDGREVQRGGQVLDDGVEQGLHALVLEGRAAEHRDDLDRRGWLPQRRADVVVGDLFVTDELLEDDVAVRGQGVEQLLAVLLGLGHGPPGSP